jgi:hypothetical protein
MVAGFDGSTALTKGNGTLTCIFQDARNNASFDFALENVNRFDGDKTLISFGLLLRDSSFKGEMTKEELAKMAAKLNGKSEDVLKLKEMIARFLVI